jgi:hypothetical protein
VALADGGAVSARIRVVSDGKSGRLAFVSDEETGSSTSLGGETVEAALNAALDWLGLDTTVHID